MKNPLEVKPPNQFYRQIVTVLLALSALAILPVIVLQFVGGGLGIIAALINVVAFWRTIKLAYACAIGSVGLYSPIMSSVRLSFSFIWAQTIILRLIGSGSDSSSLVVLVLWAFLDLLILLVTRLFKSQFTKLDEYLMQRLVERMKQESESEIDESLISESEPQIGGVSDVTIPTGDVSDDLILPLARGNNIDLVRIPSGERCRIV